MKTKYLLVFVSLLFVLMDVHTQTLEQSLLADKGDAISEFLVGKALCEKKDTIAGIQWLEKAAEQNHIDAIRELSYIFDKRKDYNKAAYWLEKIKNSKDSIDASRIKILGDYYHNGNGVNVDKIKSAELYRSAANLGNESACDALSIMLYTGDGIPVNYSEAVALFRKTNNYNQLCRAYYEGKGVNRDLIQAFKYAYSYSTYNIFIETDENFEKEIPWQAWNILYDECKRQASKGNIEAMYVLSRKDIQLEDRTKWLNKAAKLGHSEARKELGESLFNEVKKWHGDAIHSYSDQRKLLQEAAELGYAPAQNALGKSYYYGTSGRIEEKRSGVDYKKAIFWFNKSFEQDYAPAARNLALMYKNGFGVQKDELKSVELLEIAIEKGDVVAQNILAGFYAMGIGTKKDMHKAIEMLIRYYKVRNSFFSFSWSDIENVNEGFFPISNIYSGKCFVEFKECLKTCELSDHEDYCTIGYIIHDLIVAPDYGHVFHGLKGIFEIKDALPYLKKGIELGQLEASIALGDLYAREHKYSEAMECYLKVYENKEKSQEWVTIVDKNGKKINTFINDIQKKADEGNIEALCAVGLSCISSNNKKAINYLSKAANLQHPKSQNLLGMCYFYGYSIEKDLSKALYWYETAAKNSYPSGMYNMGNCYKYGWGVKVNIEKAIEFYKQAINSGHNIAKIALAHCYLEGNGVEEDSQKALSLLQDAEIAGDTAYAYIGLCYLEGVDGNQDYGKAIYYFNKANDYINLGLTYLKLKNYTEALKCFRIAADKNIASADGYIGMCYYYGYAVDKNFNMAFDLLKSSVDKGGGTSQIYHLLSNSYRNGYGVDVNLSLADELLTKAIQGDKLLEQRFSNIEGIEFLRNTK